MKTFFMKKRNSELDNKEKDIEIYGLSSKNRASSIMQDSNDDRKNEREMSKEEFLNDKTALFEEYKKKLVSYKEKGGSLN